MSTLILIGKNGQLARAITHQVAARASGQSAEQLVVFGRAEFDLSQPDEAIAQMARNLPPADGLILAAAYTAVDAAESDPHLAAQINAVAPGILAAECARRGIPLLHLSTDYVFSGEGQTPWRPEQAAGPLNIYGQTKRDGELAIISAGARAVILRTSWVYDGTGNNFMTKILSRAQSGEPLSVVDDQFGRPTYAGHLAQACLIAMRRLIEDAHFHGGIYHVSNSGAAISWADFARAIVKIAENDIPAKANVTGVSASHFAAAARRPAFSVLDISQFETEFGFKLPAWPEGLKAAYRQWSQR